jgi:hypothetical protein
MIAVRRLDCKANGVGLVRIHLLNTPTNFTSPYPPENAHKFSFPHRQIDTLESEFDIVLRPRKVRIFNRKDLFIHVNHTGSGAVRMYYLITSARQGPVDQYTGIRLKFVCAKISG